MIIVLYHIYVYIYIYILQSGLKALGPSQSSLFSGKALQFLQCLQTLLICFACLPFGCPVPYALPTRKNMWSWEWDEGKKWDEKQSYKQCWNSDWIGNARSVVGTDAGDFTETKRLRYVRAGLGGESIYSSDCKDWLSAHFQFHREVQPLCLPWSQNRCARQWTRLTGHVWDLDRRLLQEFDKNNSARKIWCTLLSSADPLFTAWNVGASKLVCLGQGPPTQRLHASSDWLQVHGTNFNETLQQSITIYNNL